MIELRSPDRLAISELLQEARLEIQAYLHKQPTADVCAFELFRRAIGQRDDQAWVCLYELYQAVVSSWILRRQPVVQSEDVEMLVNEVFAKFSRSISPEKLNGFSSVGALLAYMKRCAESVLSDYRRSQLARPREEPLAYLDQEPFVEDPADAVAEQCATQEIWQIIESETINSEERLILVVVCAWGFSPRELQRRYSHLFASVDDIYRIKRNVLERLRRNKKLLQLQDRRSHYHLREVRHAG